MIMACPRRLGFTNLIENFVNANDEVAAKFDREDLIERLKVHHALMERWRDQLNLVDVFGMQNPFKNVCYNNGNNAKCDTLKFLNWLGSIRGGEEIQYCIDDSFLRYIVNITLEGKGYDTEQIYTFCARRLLKTTQFNFSLSLLLYVVILVPFAPLGHPFREWLVIYRKSVASQKSQMPTYLLQMPTKSTNCLRDSTCQCFPFTTRAFLITCSTFQPCIGQFKTTSTSTWRVRIL